MHFDFRSVESSFSSGLPITLFCAGMCACIYGKCCYKDKSEETTLPTPVSTRCQDASHPEDNLNSSHEFIPHNYNRLTVDGTVRQHSYAYAIEPSHSEPYDPWWFTRPHTLPTNRTLCQHTSELTDRLSNSSLSNLSDISSCCSSISDETPIGAYPLATHVALYQNDYEHADQPPYVSRSDVSEHSHAPPPSYNTAVIGGYAHPTTGILSLHASENPNGCSPPPLYDDVVPGSYPLSTHAPPYQHQTNRPIYSLQSELFDTSTFSYDGTITEVNRHSTCGTLPPECYEHTLGLYPIPASPAPCCNDVVTYSSASDRPQCQNTAAQDNEVWVSRSIYI